jgi:hypothetical protein
VELYLHSPNTPSWRGAQLKHGYNFTSCVDFSSIAFTVSFQTSNAFNLFRACAVLYPGILGRLHMSYMRLKVLIPSPNGDNNNDDTVVVG